MPANGNPHLFFGEGMTVEQIYQQQLHNWLVHNAHAPMTGHANACHDNGQPQDPITPPMSPIWGAWP